jgi:hypothetical protein
MRHLRFSWDDYTQRPPFNNLITNGPAFQFSRSDMSRIRVEMSTLIGKLSELQKQEEAAKEAKRLLEKEQKICRVCDGDFCSSCNTFH